MISRAADNKNFVTRLRNLSVSLSTSIAEPQPSLGARAAFNDYYKTYGMSNFLSKVYASKKSHKIMFRNVISAIVPNGSLLPLGRLYPSLAASVTSAAVIQLVAITNSTFHATVIIK